MNATSPVGAIAAELRALDPAYAPTPLLDPPALAGRLGVSQVLAKDEGHRRLGSFKSLAWQQGPFGAEQNGVAAAAWRQVGLGPAAAHPPEITCTPP